MIDIKRKGIKVGFVPMPYYWCY